MSTGINLNNNIVLLQAAGLRWKATMVGLQLILTTLTAAKYSSYDAVLLLLYAYVVHTYVKWIIDTNNFEIIIHMFFADIDLPVSVQLNAAGK